MMKWEKITEAVYQAQTAIIKVDEQDVAWLKNNVRYAPDKRMRICAHQQDALLHEMMIIIHKDSYIRPHKHINKSESFHMIEGEMDVIIFDDTGRIVDVIPMGILQSGKHFFYRLSDVYYHTLFLRSEFAIFHETTNGPFCKEETIMAPWSPVVDDLNGVELFLVELKKGIDRYVVNPFST